MKANPCGTWAEQTRFRAGWKNSSELKGKQEFTRKRCRNCAQFDGGSHCRTIEYATTVNATCDLFRASK